jgi:esterase/lipase superfamily enzyme
MINRASSICVFALVVTMEVCCLRSVLAQSDPPTGNDARPFHFTQLFYVTNRLPTTRSPDPCWIGQLDQSPDFGTGRAPVSYGAILTTVPKDRSFGSARLPDWQIGPIRFALRCADRAREPSLVKIDALEKDVFYTRFQEWLLKSNGRRAIVYVHGFNTSFDDPFPILGLAVADLRMPIVIFSWPSAVGLTGYRSAASTADWAQHDLAEFLREFARRAGVEHVTLLAHSGPRHRSSKFQGGGRG